MKLNGLTAQAVNLVANVAPWVAPLPTAWLVYARTMAYLHWPMWVAIAAGVTLELLGVAILATALELYQYNESKRKSDPKAPIWLAALLVALYFVTALVLTMFLDVAPAVAAWAPALFPVLSVSSFALLALRTDHERRVTAIAAQKAGARAEWARKKAEQATQADATPAQADATPTKTERVRRLAELHPGWTRARLAQEVGCSASTVTRALVSDNGHLRPTIGIVGPMVERPPLVIEEE